MKVRYLLLWLPAFCHAAGCRDSPQQPEWLDARTTQIESEPMSNPPSQIFRFVYAGQVVFYRPPRCCDQQGELRDANGNTLCFPDGGFTGRGDGRCTDFFAQRRDCKLIWSDPRAKPGSLGACQKSEPPVAPAQR